jgi:prevent-host-death family protein
MSERVSIINIYEAKANLSRLVERAAAGEEIVIAKAGKPRARLVALPEKKSPVVFGALKGKIWIADDFDDPLPDDIQRAFDGDTE